MQDRVWTLTKEQTRLFSGPNPVQVFRNWIVQNKFTTDVVDETTHLDLRGGKYCVPIEREPELLALWAAAYSRQDQLDDELLELTSRRYASLKHCEDYHKEHGEFPSADSLDGVFRSDMIALPQGQLNAASLDRAIRGQEAAITAEMSKALDTNDNTTMFLVEKRMPVFMYHLDWDLVEEKASLDPQLIIGYARVVQRVLLRFYQHRYELVLCHVAASKPLGPKVDKHGQTRMLHKHGYHVYAPSLWVTAEQALTIRELLLSELQNDYGARAGLLNEWPIVVDESVYQGNGLRMLYCSKAANCSCKPKAVKKGSEKDKDKKPVEQVVCVKCGGKHKIIERARRYVPWQVLNADGELDKDRLAELQDPYVALRTVSIRWPEPCEPTPGYVRPRDAPEFFPALHGLAQGRTTEDSDEERQPDEYAGDRKCLAKFQNSSKLELEEPQRVSLQRAIRQLDPRFRSIVLYRLMRVDNPQPYFIGHVRGAGSQYCKNKGAEHKNHRIWFHVSRAGICQKCFCRCQLGADKPRLAGACRKYHSPVQPLPPALAEQLFPERKRPSNGKGAPAKRYAVEGNPMDYFSRQ